MAVVQDKDYFPDSFTNQVVADQLLRARIQSGGGSVKGAAASSLDASGAGHRHGPGVMNPGSRGHPDLCLRPCLYFAQGKCSNKSSCPFCHMPHPKRPVRFDKLHRETLRRMSFTELAAMMLPALRKKADDLELSREVQELFDQLLPVLEQQIAAASPEVGAPPQADLEPRADSMQRSASGRSFATAISSTGSEQTRSERRSRGRTFAGALQVMALRPLLAMLAQKVPEEAAQESWLVDQMLKKIHEGHLEAQLPGSQGSREKEAPRHFLKTTGYR